MRKPITRKEFARHERMIRDALKLASTHDPDHELRLATLEHQVVSDLGAPTYRIIQRGKNFKLRRK